MRRPIAPAAAIALAVVACGDGDVHRVSLLRVTPGVDPGCGAPPDARTVTVTARGEFPAVGRAEQIEPGGSFEITSFPEDTRVLEVVVEGIGGEERTIGRTREVDFASLEDGDALYLFMAPRRGFCPTGAMGAARSRPLVARAGAGFVVAGGFDGDGEPVDLVERYDPDRGAFTALGGTFYAAGLVGASMTTLDDGRVVVAGGPETAYQIYDPDADTIGQTLFLEGARAHHAAAVLPDGRLFLAGGCSDTVAGGACDPAAMLTDSILLDVDTGDVTGGPSVATPRAGGRAVVEPDGRVLISGGVDGTGDPVTQAERIDPIGGAGQGVAGIVGRPAPLATGGTLVAFADGAPSDAVAIVPAGAGTASPVTGVLDGRDGTALVSLDDGAVLALGGESASASGALLYSPALERFAVLAGVPFDLVDHAAVRLDDGTVVVLGGIDADAAVRADAWVYRHDLTSEFSAEFSLADAVQSDLLSPRDPAAMVRDTGPTQFAITGSEGPTDIPSEWAVAGAPRFAAPLVSVRGGVASGGLAVLVGFESHRDYHFVALRGGAAVQLFRVRDGARANTGCSGSSVSTADVAVGDPMPSVEVTVGEDDIAVSANGTEVLRCELTDPIPRGLIGVGVLGDSSAQIVVEQLFGRR